MEKQKHTVLKKKHMHKKYTANTNNCFNTSTAVILTGPFPFISLTPSEFTKVTDMNTTKKKRNRILKTLSEPSPQSIPQG
jgi:hypothetical protein